MLKDALIYSTYVIPAKAGIQKIKTLDSVSDRKGLVRGIYAINCIIRTPKHGMTRYVVGLLSGIAIKVKPNLATKPVVLQE